MSYSIGTATDGPWDECERCGQIIHRDYAREHHGLCSDCEHEEDKEYGWVEDEDEDDESEDEDDESED